MFITFHYLKFATHLINLYFWVFPLHRNEYKIKNGAAQLILTYIYTQANK